MSAYATNKNQVCVSKLIQQKEKKANLSSKNMGVFTNKVDVHQSRKDGCNLLGKQRRVVEFLGEGSFGHVLKCSNFETGTMEAVKVMKSCTDVIEIAKHEIQILKQLRRLDPNTSHVVRFNSFFFNMEDICLSFEFLDVDLDTYISEMSPCKTCLPLPEVRHITEQLVMALHHLKTIGIIHMDIKPENVMIVDHHEKPLQVKLVDFGGAQMSGNIDFETCIFTQVYSSAEVLLESEMNEALDMWSLGVTAFELAVGTVLFPYNRCNSIINSIVKILGQPPDHVLDKGQQTEHVRWEHLSNRKLPLPTLYVSKLIQQKEKKANLSSKNMGVFTNKVDVHQSRKDGCNLLGKQRRVVKFLGEGSFGQVLKCCNLETGTMEAVKVMKSSTNVIKTAKHEIQILKQLRRLDPNTSHVVRFNSFFFNMEDICLSFEFLDMDLHTYISEMSPCKMCLPLPEVRHITEQLVMALHHLKTIGIIHMDIKPENVMIVDHHAKPLQVKLVDFGGAQMSGNIDFETCIFTQVYSSAEVLLESEMNEALDMWSLGVTAFELAVGTVLFPYNRCYSIINSIVKILGQPPDHVLDKGQQTEEFFNRRTNDHPRWTIKTAEEYGISEKEEDFSCFDDGHKKKSQYLRPSFYSKAQLLRSGFEQDSKAGKNAVMKSPKPGLIQQTPKRQSSWIAGKHKFKPPGRTESSSAEPSQESSSACFTSPAGWHGHLERAGKRTIHKIPNTPENSKSTKTPNYSDTGRHEFSP
uniref:Protein kinase domain-containing protein n=1 Tax=Takifugu rubripes TaxID=31033 RepID=A0A3B5K0E9_TAKRU